MADMWEKIGDKIGGLAAKWTGYAALGSFCLYLLGYLALRFQLSVYGVVTSVDAFDEKYLFAGCRFLVYLVSTVPSILILLLVLVAIVYGPLKLIPASQRDRVQASIALWSAGPIRMPVAGIVFSVLFIQLVQRKCFAFVDNLLLTKELPDIWIARVLLSGEGRLALYFSGLVAGTFITGAVLFYSLKRKEVETPLSRGLVWLLAFLFAVEVLFLPVNYGILISTQSLPRVAEISGDTSPTGGSVYWLLWDSKDAITYLVRNSTDQRMLVTVPAKDARIRILAYDDILCVLFCSATSAPTHPLPEGTK
jgi:hypothetical protein